MHYYRVRLQLSDKDPQYDELEKKITSNTPITVPSLVIYRITDPVTDPIMFKGKEALFNAHYKCKSIEGVGYFPQHQATAKVAELITAFIQS